MSNDSANPALEVKAEASPATARIGDVVALDIRVDHPLVLAIDTPEFTKELGVFEVRASTRLPVDLHGDNATDHFHAELQAFTTGQLTLPGLNVTYRDPMGKASIVRTQDLKVTILEFPPGPNDKGDIRGIIGAIGPVAWSPWWWIFALALLAALCLLLWRKRQLAQYGPPPPPPIPADEEALKRLNDLASSTLLASGKVKEFYSGISDTLRAYLENGFGVPALERTTGELMRDLRRKPGIGSERQAELRELLEACDLVKFAKFKPEVEEAKTSLDRAIQFVEATRAVIPAVVGGNPSMGPRQGHSRATKK